MIANEPQTDWQAETTEALALLEGPRKVAVSKIDYSFELPHGGLWMYTQIETEAEVDTLPEWMTKHGVWIQPGAICGLIAWMPFEQE